MEIHHISLSSIIEEWTVDDCSINEVFYDPVFEAMEDPGLKGESESNPGLIPKLKESVESLIRTLIGIVDKAITKFSNFTKKVLLTDKGFRDNCRKAIIKNKPLEAIKLISYAYNDAVLEDAMNKMTNIVMKRLGNLKTDYRSESDMDNRVDMDNKEGDIYKAIFSELGCPSTITNISQYFTYLRDQFRVEKKEQLFTASKTKVYYDITMSYEKEMNKVSAKHLILKKQTAIVRTNLNSIILNKLADAKVKQRAMHHFKNASHIYNFYIHFLDAYTQLKTEEILSYRIVLQKLYHF